MCKERKLGNDIRVIHNMIGMYCDRYGADHRDGVAPMQGRTLGFLYCNKDKVICQKDIEPGILNFQGNGKQNVTVHGEKGADYQKRTKRGRTIKADSSDEKRGTAAFENDELLFWSGEAPGGWNDKRGSG